MHRYRLKFVPAASRGFAAAYSMGRCPTVDGGDRFWGQTKPQEQAVAVAVLGVAELPSGLFSRSAARARARRSTVARCARNPQLRAAATRSAGRSNRRGRDAIEVGDVVAMRRVRVEADIVRGEVPVELQVVVDDLLEDVLLHRLSRIT